MNIQFGCHYNEFKNPLRWYDYINISLFEFPILLIRKYDWMDQEDSSTWSLSFGGITINIVSIKR